MSDNFAANAGALPIQIKSLLFLIPERTALASLVSTPTQCLICISLSLIDLNFSFAFGFIMLVTTQSIFLAQVTAVVLGFSPLKIPITLSPSKLLTSPLWCRINLTAVSRYVLIILAVVCHGQIFANNEEPAKSA